MIDPLTETLVTPREATQFYPRNAKGGKVHISKIYRHIQVGVRGVRLEALNTPRLVTSKEAIARFFRRLSGGGNREAPAPPSKSCSRDQERIERALDRIGI